MDKLLPIEAGCKTVVAKGINIGMSVIVGEFIGKPHKLSTNDDCWEIDKEMATSWGRKVKWCTESFLMRIDGNEDMFRAEEREVERVISGPAKA